MPKHSLTKRTMVTIYNKMVVRWSSYVIDFTAGWSFGEQQPKVKHFYTSGDKRKKI